MLEVRATPLFADARVGDGRDGSEVASGGTSAASRTGELCRRSRQGDGEEKGASQGPARGKVQYVLDRLSILSLTVLQSLILTLTLTLRHLRRRSGLRCDRTRT